MQLGSVLFGARWNFDLNIPFQINTPTEIHFGPGASHALSSLIDSKAAKVLFVRGASGVASNPVREGLDQLEIDITEVSIPAEPSIEKVNALYKEIRGNGIDFIVACGGGAVIDAAKALRCCLALRDELPASLELTTANEWNGKCDLPLVAIPTTAGTGAEVTANAVLSVGESKISLRGNGLFPTVALVDPRLLHSAPKNVVLGAGLDAVVQTIEAYTSRKSNSYTDALMQSNLALAPKSLYGVVERGDVDSWTNLAWVSLSSGLALANGGLGAAHGLAAVLGARLNAPHGLLCGRLLGPVLVQNRASVELGSDSFKRIEACFDVLTDVFKSQGPDEGLTGFDSWLKRHRVPKLRQFGAKKDDFDAISEAAVFASSSTKNPVLLKKSDFRDILEAAY